MPGQTASRAWRLVASGASRLVAPGWARLALISVVGAAGLFLCIVLVYQLALARVPQHRAVLERLVQSQTGLDVRFGELGLRWGWYGPEAVFRRVELSEPGQANVLLRAPQLTVGFDAWRSMRSGHLEAGLITLIAPDIDVEHFMSRAISREAQTGGRRSRAAVMAHPTTRGVVAVLLNPGSWLFLATTASALVADAVGDGGRATAFVTVIALMAGVSVMDGITVLLGGGSTLLAGRAGKWIRLALTLLLGTIGVVFLVRGIVG